MKITNKTNQQQNIITKLVEIDGTNYILKESINNDSLSRNMLINEANILYKLRNIDSTCKLRYHYFTKNKNYILCEYIRGKTLGDYQFHNDLEKVYMMVKILKSIKKIHENGVIHCDIKPSNIIISDEGTIKIIDFGISIHDSISYFGEYGSIDYCSPEQLENKKLTKQSDIYSLGVLLYMLIEQKLPFNGTRDKIKTSKEKNKFILNKNQKLSNIYNKSINSNLMERYKDVDEFQSDLLDLINIK